MNNSIQWIGKAFLTWKHLLRLVISMLFLMSSLIFFPASAAAASLEAFQPVADAHVKSSSPDRNYGGDSRVRLRDSSTSYNGYFKFDVTGVTGSVSKATLHLYVDNGSKDGGTLYQTSDGWTESGITWNNAPSLNGAPLAMLGSVGNAVLVEIDVTTIVTNNGSYSFGLSNSSSNSVYFSSREGSFPPELVVEFDDVPPIPEPPVAGFSADLTNGDAALLVNFSDASSNIPTQWLWTFGDGDTSTNQNPNHTYTNSGTYTVTLTATNTYGSDTETRIDYITVSEPPPPEAPVANFIADNLTGVDPHTVNFTDLTTGEPTSWNWSFGDGNSSSIQNPSHTYNTPGSYTVVLTVSNNTRSDTETRVNYIVITAAPPPPAIQIFTPIADTHVKSSSVTRNYGSETRMRARFGDPDYDMYLKFVVTGVSQSIDRVLLRLYVDDASNNGGDVYLVANDYNNGNGVWDENGITFSNAPAINGNSVASIGQTTEGTWVEVDLTSAIQSNGTYSFAISSTSTNSAYYSTKEGSFSPELIVQTLDQPIVAPSALFTADQLSGEAPLIVNFADQSTGNPNSWLWIFGDGNTAAIQNPEHTYTNPGSYTVALTVSNSNGSDSETRIDYITVSEPLPVLPVANFVADSLSGEAPHTINFTDLTTGQPVSWSWSFGDGNSSATQNPSHVYTNAGTYTITLIVNNADGSDSETKTDYISVNDPPLTPPVAAFTADDVEGDIPHLVNFTDQSTNSPTNWIWNFGDGNSSAEQHPAHTYSVAGAYTVTLTVSNLDGSDSEIKTNYISVSEPPPPLPPVAAFTANDVEGDSPHTVSFTDQSTNNPTSWFWEFGDGSSSTDQNPDHVYTNPGSYTVILTVSNEEGSDTITRVFYITVSEPFPTANFSADVRNGFNPLTVNFTDQSSNIPTSWIWSFGDGNSSTSPNPTHIYETPGNYTVTLTVTNTDGSDAETKVDYIEVSSVPSGHLGMWISLEEIMALPNSGEAWDLMVSFVNENTESPDLSDQSTDANVAVMGRALIYARTGEQTYLNQVLDALRIITYNNTEDGSGGRTLSLGRELIAYIIAADLIVLSEQDPGLDADFRSKLSELLHKVMGSGATETLITTHEIRGNNWGTHAGATRAAIAIYLGDETELARVAQVFEGWLGNHDQYNGFDFKDTDWYCEDNNRSGVNPVGCERNGHSIDGALPDDMRRGGDFRWPPNETGYPWEAMQGMTALAQLLDRAGYSAWEWEEEAILRAATFLFDIDWSPEGDDSFIPWLLNAAYGTEFPAELIANPGKNIGWTIWTHPTAPPQPPAANFASDVLSGLSPLTVQFTDQSTGIPTDWIWNFGDGFISTEKNPDHIYSIPGTYTVQLTVTNILGTETIEKIDQIEVNVPPVPAADFSAPLLTGSAPLTISFTDNSTGKPDSWTWNFGDGETATSQNPIHTFVTPGIYTMSLTAMNVTGSNTTTKIDYIIVTEPPSIQTFTPTDDAHVKSSSATRNYGDEDHFRTRFGDPNYNIYLKFVVSGITDTVQSAKLRLYVNDGSNDGGAVYLVANNYRGGSVPWTELGITFDNAPLTDTAPLASAGITRDGTWVEIDVTNVITGNGTYNFAISNSSTNSAYYSSKEGAFSPELVIEN